MTYMIYHLQSDVKFSLISYESYAFWAFLKNAHYSKLRCVYPVVIYDHREEPPLSIRKHRYGPCDMVQTCRLWASPMAHSGSTRKSNPAIQSKYKKCSSFTYNSKSENREKMEKFENLNFVWNSLSVIIWMIQVEIHRVFFSNSS